jgi:hypothetical protein
MSEVDIWIKVMDRLGFKFIGEKSQGTGDTNLMEYVWMPTNHIYPYYLCFDRKTELVNSLFCVIGGINKRTFYNEYKDIFRQVKLEGTV